MALSSVLQLETRTIYNYQYRTGFSMYKSIHRKPCHTKHIYTEQNTHALPHLIQFSNRNNKTREEKLQHSPLVKFKGGLTRFVTY